MAEAQADPYVQFITSYVVDLSFENVGLQNGYVAKTQPKFEMNLNVTHKEIETNMHEVTLHVKIKAEEGEQTIFMLDLQHSGRFRFHNVGEAQRVPFLYIECPRLLFPYTRRIVSQTTLDGGLMPLNLDHVDFVQMFRNSVDAAKAQKDGAN